MFKRLNTILKHRVHPIGLLAGSLASLTLLTALTGMWHYQYELNHLSKPVLPVSAISYSKTNNKTANLQQAGVQGASTGSGQSNRTNTSKSSAANANQTATAATVGNVGSPGPNNSSSPAAVEVSLSINSIYKGKATLSSASNQCNVLSEALSTGLISNLDMRYNSQYKTYAVYVINGIGDSNSVWWTYTVNGKSPPYGCSNMTVRNGDSVNWQYVK